jgi:hypothetical protein
MDVVVIAVVATPVLLTWSFRQARNGHYDTHRRFQAVFLAILLAAVTLFEVDVRLSGGSGSLMRGSSYAGTPGLRMLTLVHVLGAVATFMAWLILLIPSWRRYRQALPGTFSKRHRQVGKLVYAGTVFTAVTAVAMYVVGFIL